MYIIKNKPQIVTIIILLIASLLIIKVDRLKTKPQREIDFSLLPYAIGNWQAKDLEISQREYEVLGTDQITLRAYKDNKGNRIVLYVIYSEGNRDAFHPPELCYIGSGSQLMDKTMVDLKFDNGSVLTVNQLNMKAKKGPFFTAWYWFVAGSEFVSNYYLQQIKIIYNALIGKGLNGAMIRVSIDSSEENAQKDAHLFIQQIKPYLKKIFSNT